MSVDAFRVIDGLVLRSASRNRLILLNDVGAVVWELFAAGVDVPGIVECLAQRFPKPRTDIGAEVEALIVDWRAQGLLETERRASGPSRAVVPAASTAPFLEATLRLARTTLRIRSYVPPLGPMIVGRLLHHRVTSPTPDVTIDVHSDGDDYVAWCGGHEVVREDDVPHTVSSLYRLLLRLDNPGEPFIAFVHAACLVSGGRSVLLCGCSGRGKTTLAAGLLSKGWTYLGDEIAGVVARDFSIRSLPTALSIKVGAMDALAGLLGATPRSWPSTTAESVVEAFVDPGALGPTASETRRPAAVVFPRFTKDASLASIRLSPLEAFGELIDAGIAVDGSLFAGGSPDRLIEFVETTPCHRLTYGTFDDAYRGVRTILGD